MDIGYSWLVSMFESPRLGIYMYISLLHSISKLICTYISFCCVTFPFHITIHSLLAVFCIKSYIPRLALFWKNAFHFDVLLFHSISTINSKIKYNLMYSQTSLYAVLCIVLVFYFPFIYPQDIKALSQHMSHTMNKIKSFISYSWFDMFGRQ